MKEFNEILFPIDFSEVPPKIVPWVLTMAKRFDSNIHLLFVARSLEHFSRMYVEWGTINDFQEGVIKGAELKMDEFATAHFEGYPSCKTKVILGDAAEEILNYIESEGIDLVIMGTHGRKGLERILFGSVAERVIKTSSIPVLSINTYRASVSETETVPKED